MSAGSDRQRTPASWLQDYILTYAVLLLLLAPVHAKIYKWTDRDGRVHFTDNIEAVPPEYRDQVEEKTSAPSPPVRTPGTRSAFPSKSPSQAVPSPESYTVPLHRAGNALFVDATLNDSLQVRLVVDTGAELTKISTTAARQLGVNLEDAAVIQMRSASGTYLAPLTKVKSITVGGAVVHDVTVTISDIIPGQDIGLLGMSFLDNFQVTIKAAEGQMTLTMPTAIPGQMLYGGYPEDWWRRKFRFYRRHIEGLEAYLREQPSAKFARTLRYFQAELDALDRQATQAAVPRQWRY